MSPNPSDPGRRALRQPSTEPVVASLPDGAPRARRFLYRPRRHRPPHDAAGPCTSSAILGLAAGIAVGIMVAWPRVSPRRLDPVERVAENYLKALASQDSDAIKRLGTVEEPPAIRAFQ